MDSNALRSIGGTYYVLRGLLMLPTGFLLIAAGLFNMPPLGAEPVSGSAAYFFVALGIGLAGYAVFYRHYVTRFGRVEAAGGLKLRVGVLTGIAAAAMAGAISVDFEAGLPVSAYGATFALFLLAFYRLTVGLRTYHWVFLGSLFVVSLVPVWGGVDDKVSVAMIPMGLACLGVGWFDHQELVRSITKLSASDNPGGVDARA